MRARAKARARAMARVTRAAQTRERDSEPFELLLPFSFFSKQPIYTFIYVFLKTAWSSAIHFYMYTYICQCYNANALAFCQFLSHLKRLNHLKWYFARLP